MDTDDLDVMAGAATTGTGISGETVRDMIVQWVDQRFGVVRTPRPVRWLADNAWPGPQPS